MPGSASYGVTNLYFDSDRFDVFYSRSSYGRAKYRVRRYGQSPSVFLERKLSTEATVAERRCAVDLDEVGLIAADVESWRGRWFVAALPGGVSAEELVRAVGRLEVIQDVRWERRQSEEA